MLQIEINNQQDSLAVDEVRVRKAVAQVLAEGGFHDGEISLAVISDAQIRRLNAEYLEHDWATDVLSFLHEEENGHLEGEIIVSAETASREANRFLWRPQDELLLYIIHGALHLIGYDDREEADRAAMQEAERRHLEQFGLAARYEEAS